MPLLRALTLALLSTTAFAQPKQSPPLVTVPFVGCPADGQQGPVAAPTGHPKQVDLPAAIAARLAWYATDEDAGDLGVLAPRGWHCFGTYGSNGESIYVAPEPLDANKVLLHKNWHGFTGPAIQLSVSDGGTSGRFEVARIIARVFPAHRDFAQHVIAEKFEPASDFPSGPYPTDQLHYRSNEAVEFTTPPNTKGLGTSSWLLPAASPIHGFALLFPDEEMSLHELDLRLTPQDDALATALVQAIEHEILTRRAG